eukprot:541585-Ditylum_brightwellii.AAC.1
MSLVYTPTCFSLPLLSKGPAPIMTPSDIGMLNSVFSSSVSSPDFIVEAVFVPVSVPQLFLHGPASALMGQCSLTCSKKDAPFTHSDHPQEVPYNYEKAATASLLHPGGRQTCAAVTYLTLSRVDIVLCCSLAPVLIKGASPALLPCILHFFHLKTHLHH